MLQDINSQFIFVYVHSMRSSSVHHHLLFHDHLSFMQLRGSWFCGRGFVDGRLCVGGIYNKISLMLYESVYGCVSETETVHVCEQDGCHLMVPYP